MARPGRLLAVSLGAFACAGCADRAPPAAWPEPPPPVLAAPLEARPSQEGPDSMQLEHEGAAVNDPEAGATSIEAPPAEAQPAAADAAPSPNESSEDADVQESPGRQSR